MHVYSYVCMYVYMNVCESIGVCKIYVFMYVYVYICVWVFICVFIVVGVYIYARMFVYSGCPRRKGPNFGRVFLRSNDTDITQNTYIQSSMLTEILVREECGRLWCLRTVVCP